MKGSRHPSWKGGKVNWKGGYKRVRVYGHPYAASKKGESGGYVSEHRLVMEEMLGRYLQPKETVHHKNGIKSDNRPENLELWASRHPPGQRVSDLVAFAKEILEEYEPEALR